MKEAEIIKRIREYLNTFGCKCFHWKTHGGQFGTAGIPDIIVCYKGNFIGLEVKQPGREPTKLQRAIINKICLADGFATVVTSVEEVKNIIAIFDKSIGRCE